MLCASWRDHPNTHTHTHSCAHSLLFVAANWREALPQSDGVFGPNRSSSLVWGAGRAATQQRSMTVAPWGAEACVSHRTPGSVYVFFSHPRLSVSLPPCYVSASLPPFSLTVEVFLGLPLPFVSLSPRVSHSSLHSPIYSCRALAATTVGPSYISVMGFTNKE